MPAHPGKSWVQQLCRQKSGLFEGLFGKRTCADQKSFPVILGPRSGHGEPPGPRGPWADDTLALACIMPRGRLALPPSMALVPDTQTDRKGCDRQTRMEERGSPRLIIIGRQGFTSKTSAWKRGSRETSRRRPAVNRTDPRHRPLLPLLAVKSPSGLHLAYSAVRLQCRREQLLYQHVSEVGAGAVCTRRTTRPGVSCLGKRMVKSAVTYKPSG